VATLSSSSSKRKSRFVPFFTGFSKLRGARSWLPNALRDRIRELLGDSLRSDENDSRDG
jgi:hypothetical protein